MAKLVAPQALVQKYPIISDQVSAEQIRVILTELDRTLQQGIVGAVVEFGCYIGTTSLFIQRMLQEQPEQRPFHVYDSFEGLPEKSAQDNSRAGEQFKAGELAVSKKQFIREFQKAHVPLPVIHKGWFSNLTDKDVPEQIAFAFLDGDFYDSIRVSLRLVLSRMSRGGVIIIDDYAREALPGAAKAVQESLPEYLNTHIQTVQNMGIINL
jgi:O-methyltransferase